jgi:DegV family protein with EDD domain
MTTEPQIAIVTDSSAYIPESALKGLNISIIPVWLIWDEQRYRDGVDIDPATFYQRLKSSKTLPTSSQPSPGEFVELYKTLAHDADIILNILVSSKISGTIASAESAQKYLPDLDIRIVDSLSSSMGLGLVVLAGARAVAEGQSVDQAIKAAEDMCDNLHFLFMVDTLEFLHRGGRITGGKRLLGSALKIKPILQFKDGLIQPCSQARTRGKAIAQLMKIADQRLDGKKMVEAAVVDIDAPSTGDKVTDMIAERFAPTTIHRSTVSPVVGTHVGPGAIGVAIYGE